MADNGAQSNIHECLPEIRKGRGAEMWRDVLEFKVQQQRNVEERDVENGNGGKPSGSWEIVGCSQASECGSTARTLPGSEFGLIEDAGGQAELTPEFQQTHSRVLAEIEALEAAEREALGSANIHGSHPLPVSVQVDQACDSDGQVCLGSRNTRTDAFGLSVPLDNIAVEALDGDDGLEVQVLAGDLDPGMEIGSVEERDAYGLSESVQGLGTCHVISAPPGCDSLLELQKLSQEESAEGGNCLDSGSARASGGSERLLKGIESFEDVKSVEGAFSELSFDSPTAPRDSAQRSPATEILLSSGSAQVETQQGGTEATKLPTEVENPVVGGTEMPGENLWLISKMPKLFQHWTAVIADFLPCVGVPRSMSMAKTAVSPFDWKGMAFNAGLALLSSLVLGLFVQNRRLGYEVRRKNEEVSRMMMTLANFQELWASHRMGKVPILRHTNFAHMDPHCPF